MLLEEKEKKKKQLRWKIDLLQDILNKKAREIRYEKWLEYTSLPEDAREKIKKQWDEYFEKCRNSQEAEIYRSTAAALKIGDMETVKGNAQLARDMLSGKVPWERIPEPNVYPDPTHPQFLDLRYRYERLEELRDELAFMEGRATSTSEAWDVLA